MIAKKRDFRLYGKSRHPLRKRALSVVLFVGCAFLVTILITSVFVDSIQIGSTSMEPTLSLGDRLLTTPLLFGAEIPFTSLRLGRIREPDRGEVVVCSPPFHETTILQRIADPFIRFFTLRRVRGGGVEDWEDSMFVKRVVGIPGDTIRIENFIVYIKPPETDKFINERVLSNTQYSITLTPLPKNWGPSFPFSGTSGPVTLAEGEYFVIGDNRSQSHDSRHFGVIGIKQIRQKVLFRYSPLRKVGGT